MRSQCFLLSMCLVFGFQLCVFHTHAQDSPQWHLPEGAIARLGKGSVYGFKFSADGNRLTVASGIGIWHYGIRTGEEIDLTPFPLANYTWSDVATFRPDGVMLASADGNPGKIFLWDAHTGELLKTLEGHTQTIMSISFSPDGDMLASGDMDNAIRLWDVGRGRLLKVLEGHRGSVNSVSFSPDGGMLASGSGTGDNTVRLWDVRTGQHLRTFAEHTSVVHSVSFSPDGSVLASGSYDGTIRVWDVRNGQLLKTFEGHVHSVSFSPDGSMLASGSWDGTIRLWNVGSGQPLATLKGHTDEVRKLSFNPDGSVLASGSYDGTIRVWDVRSGRVLNTLIGHTSYVHSVSFSLDGSVLASGDRKIRVWDVRNGQLLNTLEGHTNWVSSVVFSSDGRLLASGSWDNTIRLWDGPTGVHLRTLEGHGRGVLSVVFSSDGSLLASGSWDNTIRLWDAHTGRHLNTLEGHTNGAYSVSFSPDGRTLASGGSDKTIRLWDVRTGQHLKTLEGHTRLVHSVSFSPDGRTLASGSVDNTVRLWNIQSGKHKNTIGSFVCWSQEALIFSLDSRFLVIVDFNRVVMIELATGERSETIFQTPSGIETIAISPDGHTLASVGEDCTVLLSDVSRFFSEQPQPDSQQPSRNTVQLIYFRPSDRATQQGIDTQLNTLIKDTQNFYAAQMHRHDRKTITFETDTNGNAVVHHVDGQFTDTYYQTDTYNRVQKEIAEQFDTSKDVYLVAVDVSSETVNDGGQGHGCGIGGGSWTSRDNERWQRNAGGLAVIPASGDCFTVGVTAHELGHAFSLEHDFREDTYLMAYGSQSRLSEDAADWLSVHPYFNTGQKGVGPRTSFEMRSNRAAQLQFQLTDGDGLHQVQLLIPTGAGDPAPGLKLHDCKALKGETDSPVAFSVSGLTGPAEVTLQVIDVHGNITKQAFAVESGSTSVVSDVPIVSDVPVVSLSPTSASPVGIGEDLELNLTIAGGVDVAGYQATVDFDAAALRYVSTADAGYLPAGAFVVPSIVRGDQITLGATSLQGSSEGDGTLATFTFSVLTANPSMPVLSDVKLTDSNADFLQVRIENSSVLEPASLAGDVNGDGVVDVADMEAAAARLGQDGEDAADMNNNGVIDAGDLLLIAAAIEQGNAAPSLHESNVVEMFTAAEVRSWLTFARQQGLTEGLYGRGVLFLEQLLAVLTPKETALLANYPNPFNPETWIPYQLAKSGFVNISIYAVDGRLVRRLWLGHQPAGIYESRSRAVYWDGKNELGEPVASGVYFYTLTAGDFTATRKMLIRK